MDFGTTCVLSERELACAEHDLARAEHELVGASLRRKFTLISGTMAPIMRLYPFLNCELAMSALAESSPSLATCRQSRT
jgi:hypothetical protein